MRPRQTIAQFDLYLAARGLEFSAVLVGGAALSLLGLIERQTRDCDVLQPEIPAEIQRAALEFAVQIRTTGTPLQDDWLNQNPAQLADLLPEGWNTRVQAVYKGQSVTLFVLGRGDLLLTKLFAYCDRGMDLADCLAMAPTAQELRHALPWLERQDAHPDWPEHVRVSLSELARRMGHEL